MIKVARNDKFKDKVPYTLIHGKFPYKAYLEIKGNCKYGRYIVVVSNEQLSNIDNIAIKIDSTTNKISGLGQKGYINFRVREVDIFTIENIPLYVFNAI